MRPSDGGAQAITAWLHRNPGARLIVIDVLAKIRGRAAAGLSAYEADYAAIGHAKAIADTHGIALVLVHHVRKAASDDYLSEVSGTNGLAGAADATLVLKRQRGQADAMLYVTGRDVDESEYALRFIPASGAWYLMDGPAADSQPVPVLTGQGLMLIAIMASAVLIFGGVIVPAVWSTRGYRRRAAYDVLKLIAGVLRDFWRRGKP